MLWTTPASASSNDPDGKINASGDFFRADGHADQPWSIKVSGNPLVYIENCLMDHLLACRLEAFPEFSRTEYVRRFNQVMTYQFLPAYLNCDPDRKLLR